MPVACSAEMCRTVIPGNRPALVFGCRQAWGWARDQLAGVSKPALVMGIPSQPAPRSTLQDALHPPDKLRVILGTNLFPSKAPFTSLLPLPHHPPKAPTTKTLQEANSSELPTPPSPSPPASRPSSPSTSLCVNKSERFNFWIPVAPAPSSSNPFE